MANTFREVYKKTGTNSYQLVGNVGVNGVKLDIMKGASSSAAGEIGLVPKPQTGQQKYLLTGAGTWKNIDEYLGSTDISDIGDGSVKNAIKTINEQLLMTTTVKSSIKYGDGYIILNKIGKIVIFNFHGIFALPQSNTQYVVANISSEFYPKTTGFVRIGFHSVVGNTVAGDDFIAFDTQGTVRMSTTHPEYSERHVSGVYCV